MSDAVDWQIPPSLLRGLKQAPADLPVAILLRHSVRFAIPPGEVGIDVPLTDVGRRLALDFGDLLKNRLRSLHSSPVGRCVETAELLAKGAGLDLSVRPDTLLGSPGAYVLDGRAAWHNWKTLGNDGVMAALETGEGHLVGMARPNQAARYLALHMLASIRGAPGVHVFVTHDSLVGATAARLLGDAVGEAGWPSCLEGAFLWEDAAGPVFSYRDSRRAFGATPLCRLEQDDVIEFARREIGATIGFDSGARFFLAGGAFKSLLTGRPARDLDVWAPSPSDRERLIAALLNRGAVRLERGEYCARFRVAGRVVEVPNKAEPTRLEARLARFDLALSAVGVEHAAAGGWRAVIHPLAVESVRRRQVLLLKPLVNWKYALATLARMRRYASELGFASLEAEESEVWRVFDAQTPAWQAGMLARFRRVAHVGFGLEADVEAEVAARMRRPRLG